MPRIFDNIDTTLGPAIRESLSNSTRLDTAVGYFNVRGWSQLADAVDAIPDGTPKVRLLIGMAERPDQELKDALRINGSVQEIDNRTVNLLKQTASWSGVCQRQPTRRRFDACGRISWHEMSWYGFISGTRFTESSTSVIVMLPIIREPVTSAPQI